MTSPFACVLATLALSAAGAAQVYTQTFDGPNLPSDWTVKSGTWSIQNGRAIQTGSPTSYMTLNGVKLKNCVVEADVYWSGASAVQLGGVCARHAGGATEDCCMAKVQTNVATNPGLDSFWNYERPGGRLARTGITPLMTKTRIRLVVFDDQAWVHLDTTQDGIYDMVLGPRLNSAHGSAGEVGIVGYVINSTMYTGIDNFGLFDAVLVPDGTSTPKIGTTFNMKLYTQSTTIVPYVCALSLTNGGTKNGQLGGIPVGGGKRVPLGADPILDLSLALGASLGLVGITDQSGLGRPSLKIPNDPSLVGVGVHCAGVTANFANISNNHYIQFTN